MAKAKVEEVVAEEVVVAQEVVNETPVWEGYPSRDFKNNAMVWDSNLGIYVPKTTEEAPIEEVPVDETPAE
jgi:hypothetical protein